ncbi:MAG: type II toxin-antitoxin system HicB family antitoxin [Spirochaetia bacterium]|nr:type II toxin-antitoxin system HicB family antitoxin [Spirochaetia bacterium]
MNFIYPAICHFENGGYWYEFPDLPGCFSQGDSEREIVENAEESLKGYLITVLEQGKELPKASSIFDHKVRGKSFVTYIDSGIAESHRYVRKNVTLPEWLDKKAEKASINFSQTLQEALCKKLGFRD